MRNIFCNLNGCFNYLNANSYLLMLNTSIQYIYSENKFTINTHEYRIVYFVVKNDGRFEDSFGGEQHSIVIGFEDVGIRPCVLIQIPFG